MVHSQNKYMENTKLNYIMKAIYYTHDHLGMIFGGITAFCKGNMLILETGSLNLMQMASSVSTGLATALIIAFFKLVWPNGLTKTIKLVKNVVGKRLKNKRLYKKSIKKVYEKIN